MAKENDVNENIIQQVKAMEGVVMEVCGTFLWLSGETYEHRKEIKSLGFRWAAGKQMWFLPPEGWHGRRGKGWSMDHVRSQYGSQSVDEDELLALSA